MNYHTTSNKKLLSRSKMQFSDKKIGCSRKYYVTWSYGCPFGTQLKYFRYVEINKYANQIKSKVCLFGKSTASRRKWTMLNLIESSIRRNSIKAIQITAACIFNKNKMKLLVPKIRLKNYFDLYSKVFLSLPPITRSHWWSWTLRYQLLKVRHFKSFCSVSVGKSMKFWVK